MKPDETRHISRREFLKIAGLTAGSVAAGPLIFSEVLAVPRKILDRVARGPGKETWLNTVCGQCPAGCGISVRRIDGVPVYVKGNPLFPVNRGGVCPMAHGATEVLFNPDRIRNPLKRTRKEASGEAGWEAVAWEEALTDITGRLKGLISRGEGHRIAMINGDPSPLMRSLCRAWMKGVGSPNYYEDQGLIDNDAAVALSHGVRETPAWDLANSRYILNFGCNFLEEGVSPVYYQQLFGHLRSARREGRTTLVHIDSRMNLTAVSSDRWVPIRPGTHGALALGIAHVLIVSKLYDVDFVRNHTFGFTPFRDDENTEHMGFEGLVRANYYPEKVSQITGVPAETIIQLAEEFGTHQPSVAVSGDVSRYATNGTFSQWAVYCLNALTGNIQRKGGVYFTPPVPGFSFPEPSPDSRTRRSLSRPKVGSGREAPFPLGEVTVDQFARAVVSGDGEAVDTLIIVDANPLFHSRDKSTLARALDIIPQVVVLGIFLDETARHADMVLPDHSFLEKIDISGPLPGLMFGHVGLQRPVIDPVYDTRQSGDVLMDLGRRLVGEASFPWKDYKELVRKHLEAIYVSGEGSIISESSDAEWMRYLKERGWKLQQYETFTAFQKLLVTNGGWWNPMDPTRQTREIFQTPSGRFEFFSSTLKAFVEEASRSQEGATLREKMDRLLSRLHISARGDDLFLPHYEPPFSRGKTEQFPLILTASELLTNRGGKGASQPSMMEIVGIQVGKYWTSWIDIHPETAGEYGLHHGEMAWVESQAGRIEAEVRLTQGIRPGVVHIHLGLGHTAYGRFGTGIGANATDVIEDTADALTGTPAWNGSRVRIGAVRREA
ncbi:MAG: molybdopterin-dependent oxidoreductase [Fidelibacterota bacterium]